MPTVLETVKGKKNGDPILSADWNKLVEEVDSLIAKLNCKAEPVALTGSLSLVGEQLQMPGGSRIAGAGRLHIKAEETLYLLPKNGVSITRDWGASGDLRIDGTLAAATANITTANLTNAAVGALKVSGRLSIGAADPVAALDVNGMGWFRNNDGGGLAAAAGAGLKISTEKNEAQIFSFDYGKNKAMPLRLQGAGGDLWVGGSGNGYLYLMTNNDNRGTTLPLSGGGLALGWNYSGGEAEVNFFNLAEGNWSTAFRFSRKTGASTADDLLSISTSGHVYTKGPLNVGGTTLNLGGKWAFEAAGDDLKIWCGSSLVATFSTGQDRLVLFKNNDGNRPYWYYNKQGEVGRV